MSRPFIILLIYLTSMTVLGTVFHPLFFMMFILPAILIVIDAISTDFNTSNLVFGIFQLRNTKRVHTQYGRFYIVTKDDTRVRLFQDKIFWLKYIGYTHFGSVDQIKSWIKSEYDEIYRVKMKKDEVTSQIKGWNGYIDIQTERDKKLDKIL